MQLKKLVWMVTNRMDLYLVIEFAFNMRFAKSEESDRCSSLVKGQSKVWQVKLIIHSTTVIRQTPVLGDYIPIQYFV